MTHDFDIDFNFSSTPTADALVRRACYRLVIGCCGVCRARPDDDRRGKDYWVSTARGRLSLDLKLRRRDFGARRGGAVDCVIELDGYGASGWLLKAEGADLILFACIDTNRVALFEKVPLRTAVMLNLGRWLATGVAREITTDSHRNGRSWQSRAVIIDADTLADAIERLGDGAANDGDHR